MNIPECCTHCKTMQKHNCIFQESCVIVRQFLTRQTENNLPIVYQRGRRLSNGKCEWVNA